MWTSIPWIISWIQDEWGLVEGLSVESRKVIVLSREKYLIALNLLKDQSFYTLYPDTSMIWAWGYDPLKKLDIEVTISLWIIIYSNYDEPIRRNPGPGAVATAWG